MIVFYLTPYPCDQNFLPCIQILVHQLWDKMCTVFEATGQFYVEVFCTLCHRDLQHIMLWCTVQCNEVFGVVSYISVISDF